MADIFGTRKFMIMTENTPTLPPSPAKEPTDFPLKRSLGKVCTLPMANWNPKSTKATITTKFKGLLPKKNHRNQTQEHDNATNCNGLFAGVIY